MSCRPIQQLPGCVLFALCWVFAFVEAVAAPDLFPTRFEVLTRRTPCPGTLPASEHPYGNFLDRRWTNACPGARAVEISFDSRTYLEYEFDYLYITDAQGTNIPGSPFTGETLAGQTLTVPGDTVVIGLGTDGAVAAWGFAVSSISALAADPAPSIVAGHDLHVFWEVENRGTQAASGEWWDTVYVSSNAFWTSNAMAIGLQYRSSQTLAPGAKYSEFQTFPAALVSAGDYYIILRANNGGTVAGENENNNQASLPLRVENIDLAAVTLSAPSSAAPQQSISVTWMVTNLSAYAAGPYWWDAIYWGEGAGAQWLGSETQYGPLPGGSGYVMTREITVPSVPAGTHHLQFRANDFFHLPENIGNNNTSTVPISISTPDLVVLSGNAPANGIAGEFFAASFAVSNAGPVTAYGQWYDMAYVSRTNVWTPDAVPADTAYPFGPLAPGMVYTQYVYMTLPGLNTRDAYLLLRADARTNLFDPMPDNNVIALPLHLDAADLVPISLQAGLSTNLIAAPQQLVTLSWEVENMGTAPARGGWSDTLLVATDSKGTNIIGWLEGFWNFYGEVSPGEHYSRTQTVRLPGLPPGSYYVILHAADNAGYREADDSNNVLSLPMTITAIDLVPESLVAPASVAPRQHVDIQWTVRNQGPSTAYPIWNECLTLRSATNLADVSYIYCSEWTNAVPAGATYTRTQNMQLPPLSAGDYVLMFETYYPYSVAPVDPTNNRITIPIHFEAPDLVAAQLTVPAFGVVQSNVQVSLLISNAGPVTAYPGWRNEFYLSPTNRWVPETWHVGTVESTEGIAAGSSRSFDATLSLANVTAANYRYLIAQVAPWERFDPNPANNEVATALQVRGPDLVVELLSVLEFYTNCPGPFPESPHPYPQTFDRSWTNSCPGADALKVTFDTRTETYLDIIEITDGTGIHIAGSPFEDYPLSGVTLVVPGDTVRIRFVASHGAGEWGFAVSKIEGYRNVTNIEAAPQQPLDIQWVIRNAGDGPTLRDWLDQLTIRSVGPFPNIVELLELWRAKWLGPGDRYFQSQMVQLPGFLKPGRHELVVETDTGSEVNENSESNNALSIPIRITSPDLIAVDLQAPSTADGQSQFEVVWEVLNFGPVDAFPEWADRLYISATNRVTPEAIFLSWSERYSRLPAGSSYMATQMVSLPPLAAGSYYVIVKADGGNALFDPDPDNNEYARPIAIENPDLVPIQLSAYTTGAPCPGPYAQSPHPYPANVNLWRTNSCPGAAALRVTLDYQTRFGPGDELHILDGRGRDIRGSPFFGNYWYYSGETHYVAGDTVIFHLQSDATENAYGFAVSSIVPLVAQPPTTLTSQAEFDLLYIVENRGPAAALGYGWRDRLFLSTDGLLDAQDRYIGDFGAGERLRSGARYVGYNRVKMPGIPAGDYFLILRVDEYNSIAEVNETNNTIAMPVHFDSTDLQVTALTATNRASPRESISVSWSVRNAGAGPAWPNWIDNAYLSTSPVWSVQATYLRTFSRDQSLAAGASYTRSETVSLPPVPAGDYYLIIRADAQNQLADGNPADNFRSVPIRIVAPDLAAISFSGFRTIASCPGPYPETPDPLPPSTTFRWTNSCPGASTLQVIFDSTYVEDSLSIMDGNGMHIAGSPFTGYIGSRTKRVPGDTVIIQFSTTWYTVSPRFRVADISSVVETNNLFASPQEEIALNWQVQNIGEGTVIPQWSDRIYLVGDSMSRELGWRDTTQPLLPGAGYQRQMTVNVGAVPAGTYELMLSVDAGDSVPEARESNNGITLPIVVGPPADLRPLVLNAPATLTTSHRHPSVDVSWSVTNQGVAAARPVWYDRIYLSRDGRYDPNSYDPSSAQVGAKSIISSLAPGETYTATQTVTLNVSQSGLYYLLLYVDDPDWDNHVFESNETNNSLVVPIEITLTLPDLVVTDFTAPPLVASSQGYTWVPLRWVVRNQGIGSAVYAWYDSVYLNGEYAASVYHVEPLPLAPGESYTNESGIYLTFPTNGVYSLTLKTDDELFGDLVLESNGTNNSRSISFEFVCSPRELVFPDEGSNVGLHFFSEMQVSKLNFDLHVAPDKVTDVNAAAQVPEISWAITYQRDSGVYEVRFETEPGQYLIGLQEISRIYFRALPSQSSAFVPFVISNLVAQTRYGEAVPVSAVADRAVIIGSEPLLEATPLPSGEHALTIYGLPASNVVVETQLSLRDNGWTNLWQGPFTNRFQSLGPFLSPNPSRFYRARY